MTLRLLIEETFERKAFLHPLFYSYSNGIRLELSQTGSSLNQFLTAIDKARKVCDKLFHDVEGLTVILCTRAWGSKFSYRKELRALHQAGILVPKDRTLWVEMIDDAAEDDEDNWWIRLAFNSDKEIIPNLLWCALSLDLGIKPCPRVDVYIADLENKILLFPYDDRGMDVVGPNHERLSEIYREFYSYALEFDRAQMEATFNNVP